MLHRRVSASLLYLALSGVAGGGCGRGGGGGGGGGGTGGSGGGGGTTQIPPGPNGNPNGNCPSPPPRWRRTFRPTTVVGTGTADSCTAAAVAAVAGGGGVTFNCGSAPVTIVVPEIDIINDGGIKGDRSVTIDGGELITLSGGGRNRVLRQNTCDRNLHYTSSHCQDQETPHLVLQNIGLGAGKAAANATEKGAARHMFQAARSSCSTSASATARSPTWERTFLAGRSTPSSRPPSPYFIVNSTFDGNNGSSGGALGSIGTSVRRPS